MSIISSSGSETGIQRVVRESNLELERNESGSSIERLEWASTLFSESALLGSERDDLRHSAGTGTQQSASASTRSAGADSPRRATGRGIFILVVSNRAHRAGCVHRARCASLCAWLCLRVCEWLCEREPVEHRVLRDGLSSAPQSDLSLESRRTRRSQTLRVRSQCWS